MADIIHNKVCNVSKYCINIRDSYDVKSKKEMAEILYVIQHRYPECEVFKVRKGNNLLSEGQTHNRLYAIGLGKNHTKDVDLDTEEPGGRRLLYAIIGI